MVEESVKRAEERHTISDNNKSNDDANVLKNIHLHIASVGRPTNLSLRYSKWEGGEGRQ